MSQKVKTSFFFVLEIVWANEINNDKFFNIKFATAGNKICYQNMISNMINTNGSCIFNNYSPGKRLSKHCSLQIVLPLLL